MTLLESPEQLLQCPQSRPEIFAEMLQQMTNDAPGYSAKLDNLPDTINIVAFARFKALNQLSVSSRNVGRSGLHSISLAQPCDFQRQITLLFQIVKRFDDARPSCAKTANRGRQVDGEPFLSLGRAGKYAAQKLCRAQHQISKEFRAKV